MFNKMSPIMKYTPKLQLCRISLLLLFFLTNVLQTYSKEIGDCADEVKQCNLPLENLQLEDEAHVVPAYTKEEAEQLCETYAGVKACIKKFQHTCHEIDQLFLEMGHRSFEYFCKDNLKGYLTHHKCLATPLLHEEGKSCNYTWHISTNGGTYQQGTKAYRRGILCPYIKNYLVCIYHFVEIFCGTDAAIWQRDLDEVSLAPAAQNIGCDLFSDDDEQRNLIIIACTVTFGLVLLFIAAGIGFWYCSKRKHSTERQIRREIYEERARTGSSGSAVYTVPNGTTENGGVYVNTGRRSIRDPVYSVPPPYSEKPPAYQLDADSPSDAELGGAGAFSMPTGAGGESAGGAGPLPRKEIPSFDLPPYDPNDVPVDFTTTLPEQGELESDRDMQAGAYSMPISEPEAEQEPERRKSRKSSRRSSSSSKR